jgi:hypothetical protein
MQLSVSALSDLSFGNLGVSALQAAQKPVPKLEPQQRGGGAGAGGGKFVSRSMVSKPGRSITMTPGK